MASKKPQVKASGPKRHYAPAATAEQIRSSLQLSESAVRRIKHQLEQSGALRRIAEARARLDSSSTSPSKR